MVGLPYYLKSPHDWTFFRWYILPKLILWNKSLFYCLSKFQQKCKITSFYKQMKYSFMMRTVTCKISYRKYFIGCINSCYMITFCNIQKYHGEGRAHSTYTSTDKQTFANVKLKFSCWIPVWTSRFPNKINWRVIWTQSSCVIYNPEFLHVHIRCHVIIGIKKIYVKCVRKEGIYTIKHFIILNNFK